MTYSAWLVALRNSAQKSGNQVRQGANRAAQQAQRPVQNQTQRAASTQATPNAPPKHPPITDEEAYDFLALDVSLGRL